jgi:hypothetical protein
MLARTALLAAATQAFTAPRSRFTRTRRPRTAIVKASAADVFEVATGAFDWTCNLGAPAALVAGAVMATSQEYKDDESLVTREADHRWVRQAKKMIKVLLVGSFACEVLCVFVSTVTGTMLLSSGEGTAHAVKTLRGRDTAMGFLQANHEFEYLTCRLSFLNGLLSWLGAVALKYAIPQPEEGESTRKMNRFAASLLTSTMVLMVSFYNAHLNFYPNYIQMVLRWCKLAWHGVVGDPVEPLIFCGAFPFLALTTYLGWKAFTAKPDEGSDSGVSYS